MGILKSTQSRPNFLDQKRRLTYNCNRTHQMPLLDFSFLVFSGFFVKWVYVIWSHPQTGVLMCRLWRCIVVPPTPPILIYYVVVYNRPPLRPLVSGARHISRLICIFSRPGRVAMYIMVSMWVEVKEKKSPQARNICSVSGSRIWVSGAAGGGSGAAFEGSGF